MINKYNDFLSESRIINLLLERDLNCSDEFLSKLNSISSKSSVAKILYHLFSEEKWVNDAKQNYIATSDKDDSITFLPDKKAEKAENEEGFSDFFTVKGRTEVKVGRFAKALLSDKNIIKYISILRDGKALIPINDDTQIDILSLKDKDFEEFVNLYKATKVKIDHKFEVVTGKQIRVYYDSEIYAYPNRGTLGASCMKHEECQDYFDIYVKNPETCSLLVYLDSNGYVLGRALLWKLSKSPCDAKFFLDRIYTSSDSDIIKFINYADENGWMYRYRQNCDQLESLIFKYQGKTVFGEVRVDLSKSDFEYYPYLDTLYNLNVEKKYLSNVSFAGVAILHDTGGNAEDCYSCSGDGVESNGCLECEGTGNFECTKCDGEGCKKCDGEGYVDCKVCKGSGDGPCSECAGLYLIQLRDLTLSITYYGLAKDDILKEIDRVESELKGDKEKDKKDKKKKKK